MTPLDKKAKTNYLNKRDLLREIHKSKSSYCEFDEPEYSEFDAIVYPSDLELSEYYKDGNRLCDLMDRCLDREFIDKTKIVKAAKINIRNKALGIKTSVTKDDIDDSDLVFRIISYDHIPDELNKKNTPKTIGDIKPNLNFTPFVHYTIKDGQLVLVGKSHHKDGKFTITGGKMTDELAAMLMLQVNRIGQKHNWRLYTYLSEMKGYALLHLVSVVLKFNEHKSDNPFSYLTTVIEHAFTRILNEEKKMQDIRDDLLESMGVTPSYTRQLDNDMERLDFE